MHELENKPHQEQTDRGKFPILNTLDVQWRMKLLFVKYGYAQAGDFAIEYMPETWFSSMQEYTSKIAGEINTLGIYARNEVDAEGIGWVRFGADGSYTKGLQTALSHDKFGDLYGIPATAIAAFPDHLISDGELPSQITSDPLFAAIPFQPSRQHFASEWSDFRSKAVAIYKQAPEVIKNLKLEALYS